MQIGHWYNSGNANTCHLDINEDFALDRRSVKDLKEQRFDNFPFGTCVCFLKFV